MKKTEKTNVMRLLEQRRIPYESHCYLSSGVISGADVARVLGQDPATVFKTLVTVGRSGQHYVFVIPVLRELELRRAAAAVGEKSVAMVKSKELLPLTGYIHGGCSPIGMKKPFPTVFDRSLSDCETVFFSAGKIGYQVSLKPADLEKILPYRLADLTAETE